MNMISVSLNGTLHWQHIRVASTFFQRLVGLLNTPVLTSDGGLLLTGCNNVHTIGMRYPIDLVFLDQHQRVTSVAHTLAPCRFCVDKSAAMVLELCSGQVAQSDMTVGDTLHFGATQ